MAGWGAVAAAGLTVAGNAITKGSAKKQYRYNKKLAEFQNELNRANAEWAFEKELELRKYQAEYDSPKAQRARFEEAGMNPNLAYGQGTPGTFEAPNFPSVPGVSVHPVNAAVLGDLGTQFNQARLMAAQTDLTRAKTEESTIKQDLIAAQTEVTKANPYLEEGYVKAMVAQLEATAKMKQQEAKWRLRETWTMDSEGQMVLDAKGMQLMNAQLARLEQQFDLGNKDLQVKAQIIKSKEFENALKQIQVEWMKNAEITPQHIYQGIFMILQSLMRK